MKLLKSETQLVKHTPREKIFLKIYERKEKRQEERRKQYEITQKQRVSEKELLKKLTKESPEEFYKMIFLREFEHRLMYDDTCLTFGELREYSDAELEALEEAVFLEVRSIYRKDISAALFVPIFGWAFGIGFFIEYFSNKENRQFDQYHYLKYRKITQKKGISLSLAIREHAAEQRKKETYDISDACTL